MQNDWIQRLRNHTVSVDTNILIYAVSAENNAKVTIAKQLITALPHCDSLLSLQALAEFTFVGIRKLRLSPQQVLTRVNAWMTLFPVVHATPATLPRAIHAVADHKLSFWDAMLWATIQQAGATVLFSEDLQHNQVIGGVRIINPFQTEAKSE